MKPIAKLRHWFDNATQTEPPDQLGGWVSDQVVDCPPELKIQPLLHR